MKYTYIVAAAAAALLAAPKADARNRLKLPSFRGIAEVCARIPGRIRLYMPAIAARPADAERMKAQLESTGAVREVRLNPETATALFFYDARQVEAAVVEGAAIRLLGLDEAIKAQPVSRVETALHDLFEGVNHGILEATNGLFDARMLAGTALTAAALRSLIMSGAALPGALTLFWWASSVFRRHGHD